MKCRTMLHFIWVFTVCQSTQFGVSGLQRVKGKNLFLPLILAGQTLFPYYMITMVIPLAVSVVLSILAVSVRLLSATVGTYCICANA